MWRACSPPSHCSSAENSSTRNSENVSKHLPHRPNAGQIRLLVSTSRPCKLAGSADSPAHPDPRGGPAPARSRPSGRSGAAAVQMLGRSTLGTQILQFHF